MADQDRFRIVMCQLNPTVGDINGNLALAREAYGRAREMGADLVAFPEMFVTGYQTQDLILKRVFVETAIRATRALAEITTGGPALAIGAPDTGIAGNEKPMNAYWVLEDGKVAHCLHKHLLPNFHVFDEERLFERGEVGAPYQIGPIRIGSPICEDSWHPQVAKLLAERGAEVLLIPNGSPYFRDKFPIRKGHMAMRATETGLPLAYVNLTGAQDDQIFDGASFALNPDGEIAVRAPVLEDALVPVDLERGADGWRVVSGDVAPQPDAWEQDWKVMVTALGDYCRKSGFKKVLLGLSGGIDSAICAAIASDALGPENVRCVMLPSEYTSEHSLEDAKETARRLGCPYDVVPISAARDAVTDTLAPLFAGQEPGVTEENIQSRLRGVMLMALSNKFGEMLLTTGNKSEVAVGYATIYGDMAGGYNPIKDLYKSRVFEQCRWRNANHCDWMQGPAGEVIPQRVIDKPPSAELRPDQKDSDSLPPYDVLDAILAGLVDHEQSVDEIVQQGYDRATVVKVQGLLYNSEYKRFQSAPGARLTPYAFWLDRRYPIVNRWRDH